MHLLRINAVCKTARAVGSPDEGSLYSPRRLRLAPLAAKDDYPPDKCNDRVGRNSQINIRDKFNATGVASSAARTFGATGPAAEDDFFCKLRLRGAKQATPHQTPPSTPSTIFRKTATVVHSDVKAPSIQKIARKLLWFRFFVLLLGIAICRIGRREFCSCKIWGDFYAPTKHKNARRVISHAPDSGVQVMSYGRGFLCCWRQGISPEPNSDNARLTFHLFRRVA